MARKKRGRRPFSPTKPQRKLVRALIASGISEPVIATRFGICQNTLRKHFAADLDFGRETAVAENVERLVKAADNGNVAAMKHLGLTFASAQVSNLPEVQPRLGKKEVQRQEAMTAGEGTDWGDDLKKPSAVN